MKMLTREAFLVQLQQPNDSPKLHLAFTVDEIKQLRLLIDRALNTLDPRDWNLGADLDKVIDKFLAKYSTTP